MKKNLLKILMLLIFIIIISFSIQTKTYAMNNNNIIAISKLNIDTGNYKPVISEDQKFNSMVSTILGIIQVIGAIALVIGIAIIGFKSILGSAEEKAVDKNKFIGLIVGAIMLLGGSTIAKFIISAIE